MHMDAAAGQFGDCIVCVTSDITSTNTISWIFEVRLDGANGTEPQELTFALYQGGTREHLGSGFILDVGVDYYVAAAVDLLAGEVTFWVQDLTNGAPLQSSVRSHSRTALNAISHLTIGNDGTGHPGFAWDGLIDEVRISDAVLAEDELLTSNTAFDPLKGLISWWPLDGNALDASGNDNNGQVNGAVPCDDRSGNPSGAMCFDADLGQYINIGNQVKPPFPFTMAAWIKPKTSNNSFILRNDLWS